jgi:hypothetical protein
MKAFPWFAALFGRRSCWPASAVVEVLVVTVAVTAGTRRPGRDVARLEGRCRTRFPPQPPRQPSPPQNSGRSDRQLLNGWMWGRLGAVLMVLGCWGVGVNCAGVGESPTVGLGAWDDRVMARDA